MVAGFRKMLKGISDGEFLTDAWPGLIHQFTRKRAKVLYI